MTNKIGKIVNEVFNTYLTEGEFKQGDELKIGIDNETLGRKIIRQKYNLNPDDFEYQGNGRFVYKTNKKKPIPRTTKPKFKSQYLGRKEDETEQEYLERVRELNPRFASIESEIPGEKWTPIVNKGRYFNGQTDYEKSYEISNMGRIRIINFEDPMRSRISTGYDAPTRNARQFHLDIPDYKTTPTIHNMVADAWLQPPDGNSIDYDVEHIDGDYHNNRADNLRYVPRKGRRGRPKQITNNENINRTNMKQITRLTEQDLHRIVKESVKRVLNEVGDTEDGQRALGALQARKVINADGDTVDNFFDNQSKEGGKIYNYAKDKRASLGNDSDENGNTINPLYKSYTQSYIDYLNSHPEEYAERNNRLRKLGYYN